MDGHDTGHCFQQLTAMVKRKGGGEMEGFLGGKGGGCYGFGGGLHVSVISTLQSTFKTLIKSHCVLNQTPSPY